MGKAFGESAGGAKKNELEYIKFNEGENKMRLVGELLPRYCYWKKLGNNNIPVECLSFDREKERFLNLEKDWFKHHFPKNEKGEDMRCVWSYVIQVIDLSDGKLKLCGLKKKLFDQIKELAESHNGDPTDPVKGWDVVFKKRKTGPHAFNVEYVLDQLASKKRELTKDEKELIANLKPIDELIPRPTADEQKSFIEQAWLNKEEENVDDDAAGEFSDANPKESPF